MNDDNCRRSKRLRLLTMSPTVPPSLAEMKSLEATIVNVEQFLCIEDTINLSKTCHAIRNILVHNPNGAFPKIKVSHFEVVDDNAAVATAAPTLPSHRRRNNFVSNALAKIHFPTLQRLVINFRKGTRANELRDSFIYLALGLERAVNLEELTVDFTPFLMERNDFLSQNNYDTLSANLCRCTKLKRLKVINHAEYRIRLAGTRLIGSFYSFYSPYLLAAFIPAIEQGVSTIEGVSFDFGKKLPFTYVGDRSVDESNVVSESSDLFRKILLCNKLKELSLSFKGEEVYLSPLFHSFLQVSRDIHSEMEGNLPSPSIEKMTIKCEEVKVGRGESGEQIRLVTPWKPNDLSVAPLMDMISKQRNLVSSNVFMDGL